MKGEIWFSPQKKTLNEIMKAEKVQIIMCEKVSILCIWIWAVGTLTKMNTTAIIQSISWLSITNACWKNNYTIVYKFKSSSHTVHSPLFAVWTSHTHSFQHMNLSFGQGNIVFGIFVEIGENLSTFASAISWVLAEFIYVPFCVPFNTIKAKLEILSNRRTWKLYICVF